MLEPNRLKKGVIIKYRGNPVMVLEYSHTHMGRGSATVTAKIKDMVTGGVQTLNFKAGDKLDEADVTRIKADFLYADNELHLMDTTTYDQYALSKNRVGEKLNFLKEGQEVTVMMFEGNPVDIELPPKVELMVTETEPAVKGDTASGTAYKPATLETGYVVSVPLFVVVGDVLRINTETGGYVERA